MKSLYFFFISLSLLYGHLNAQELEPVAFNFGERAASNSGININSNISYEPEKGYGFDFNTSKKVILKPDCFSAQEPVYFSVKLPEGNYKVELLLGSVRGTSKTTVRAESRRLMLREISVPEGETVEKAFVVNIRKALINEKSTIKLKEREFDDLNWDDRLSLEFSGMSVVKSIKIMPVEHIKTIFLTGNSTVTDQDLEPWGSWGQFITQYFNNNVVISNYASSGASLSSFKDRKRLEKVLSVMQPGDYMLIEFGHNDEKRKGEGIGPWQSFTELLNEFVTSAREKGGIPILVTPCQRRFFNTDGTLNPTHGDFPDAIRKVAEKLDVPLIDLTKMTTAMYESWGDNVSRKAFVQYPAHTFPGQEEKLEDNTHFNSFGANQIALAIIKGIRDLNLEIKNDILPETPEYDPKNPDQLSSWTVPMSPRFENTKPDGN